jgi:hypothetical protein
MSKLSKKLIEPHSILIEKTAAEFAGTFFEAARSSGMKIINLQGERIDLRRYKNNPVRFAKAHFEKFIPAATHALIEIMSKENTPISMKDQIYQAILERTNDPDLDMMAKTAGDLPEFEQTVLYKSDQEKPKPVIINTPKIDFDYNNRKV